MMESERSHRSGSSSSELFICFTSRPSSSMKISSKSILSPGRTDKFREPTLSLSSSLSRRLKSNGSMKGGQSSPMFPTGSKKKGCAFENPEPSSPKVTCIGQVRVKTKKQGKKMRTRSKRRGEVSFRKTEQTQEGILQQQQQQQQQQECLPHRNQRWVHLPLTICEALKAFGAEFNCFLPCGGRSSCSSTSEREKSEKRTTPTATTTSSCGAVFARWLMALQEGEEEKRRDIELVGGEEETREKRELVGEIEIEISEEKGEAKEEIDEEEEGRISICIPPRNALLLMRCRSEPLRMSSLANRFWDSPAPKDEDDDDEDEDEDDENEEEQEVEEEEEEDEEEKEVKLELEEEHKEVDMLEKWVSAEGLEEHENTQKEENPEDHTDEKEEQQEQQNPEKAEQQHEEEEEEEEQEQEQEIEHREEGILVNGSSPETLKEEQIPETEEHELQDREEVEDEDGEDTEERRASSSSSTACLQSEVQEEEEPEAEPESTLTEAAAVLEDRVQESTEEKGTEEGASETQEKSARGTEQEPEIDDHEEEEESKERERDVLPDCLLLMMCEPKLSMEVSKETWVCSTDFIRCRPEKQVIPKNGGDECKKRVSMNSNTTQQQQQQQQPPRSSCSNPTPAVAPSMATMIEQKLVNAVAYEPFVLTRCKSEPLRSAAKLAPEACFWKNRKLEPHRPSTLGVGAAGIGF